MSVVTGQARRRWAVLAAAVVVLICLPVVPAVAAMWASDDPSTSPAARELLAKALRSKDVTYTGLAVSRGNLGLPDLPSAGAVTAALGGTTRSRVWWASRDLWRVSVLSPTGEQGTYDLGGQTYLWSYEQNSLTHISGVPQLRLPRADDLLPPQASWRLLAGVGPSDRVELITARHRVAGLSAQGFRIRPADARSTIGSIDVWTDPQHGLPIGLSITDAHGVVALESQFSELNFGLPELSDLRVPLEQGMQVIDSPAPDLASQINRFGALQLPAQLAGFASSAPIVGGTATYGTGLVRFVVLPVPRRNAAEWARAARSGASEDRSLSGGEGLLISAGALNLVVAQAGSGRVYAIAGLVSADVLFQAATELFAHPPPRRGPFGPA